MQERSERADLEEPLPMPLNGALFLTALEKGSRCNLNLNVRQSSLMCF